MDPILDAKRQPIGRLDRSLFNIEQ